MDTQETFRQIKSVIIIQCRYDSRRLPGKILKSIGDTVVIRQIIDNLRNKYLISLPIIIATSTSSADDEIENWYLDNASELIDVSLNRGSRNNVMRRIFRAAEGYDYIVRITGDDLFTDGNLLTKLLQTTIDTDSDYGYLPGLVRGFDCDVFKRDAIAKVLEKFPNYEIEHIEHFVNSCDFKINKLFAPNKLCHESISLTLDTEKDYDLIKSIYRDIRDLSTEAIINYLEERPAIPNINKNPLISIYLVHKNYSEFVLDAIRCVMMQTFQDYEFIILDYGSENNDLKKLLGMIDLDKRIKFYYKPQETFIDAIKYAISKCSAKYVIRADADDMMYPDCLNKMYYEITHSDNSMIISNYNTDTGSNIDGQIKQLTCQSMIEKKKYDYIKYIEGQQFRDGITLIETFKKYGFKIGFLTEPLFYHSIHNKKMTNVDPQIIKNMDDAIKTYIHDHDCEKDYNNA